MKTVEEYLSHATKAEEMAAGVDDPFHKDRMGEIAKMWRELAEHRKRLLESKPQKS